VNGLRKRGHSLHEIGSVRRGLDLFLSKKPINVRFVNYYEKKLKLIKPDVILSFYDYDCSICMAAHKLKIPIVVSVHIWWPICPRLTLYIDGKGNCNGPNPIKCLFCGITLKNSVTPSKILKDLRQSFTRLIDSLFISSTIDMLAHTNAIIVPANHMRVRFAHYGLKNVRVIYNGVDINEMESALLRESQHGYEDELKIILNPTGYIGEYKGFPHFIQLAKHLKSRYRESVEFIATGYAGNGVVKGVGYVPRSEYLRLLAHSFLIVIPVLWEEPFSMVALEAMAMGKPVVAYSSGGLREIIENKKTGLLVAKGDLRALTEAVEYLINNPEEAYKIGLRARDRVRSVFTADRMIIEYEKILTNIAY
ncbi:MAG: glycosyltransferase family 4 protein, partial [Fervidicoccus fontis]